FAPTLVPADSAGSAVKLMRVSGGVLVFSTVRILRSNKSGPSPGLMVFGHYLDDTVVQQLEETSQSPVKLVLLDEYGAPMGAVHDAATRWLAMVEAQQSRRNQPAQQDTYLQTNDGETLDSYLLLRDVEGRPLAVLANSVSHAALQLGR